MQIAHNASATYKAGLKLSYRTVGWILTGVWSVVVATVVWFRRGDFGVMELNNWGDFLAGTSAPLALLWVVVGYYQQGEELCLSREELALQRQEIARLADSSAEQTKALARQAEAAEKSAQMNKEDEERAARPQLYWHGAGSGSGRGGEYVDIRNRGGEVYEVKLQYTGDHTMDLIVPRVWETDTVRRLHIKEKPMGESQVQPFDFPIRFTIFATDRLGYRHQMGFEFSQDFSELKYLPHTWKAPASGN